MFIWVSSINTFFFLGMWFSSNWDDALLALIPLLISLPLIVIGSSLITTAIRKKLPLAVISIAELLNVIPLTIVTYSNLFLL